MGKSSSNPSTGAPLSSLPPTPADLERVDRHAWRAGLAAGLLAALAAATWSWSAWTPQTRLVVEHYGGRFEGLLHALAARPVAALGTALGAGFLLFALGHSLVWCLQLVPGMARNRKLVTSFVRRDLRGRYAGSWLGFFWSVVNPFVNLAVYLFVFRIVLNARWGDAMGAEEVTFIMLAGIVIWSALAESMWRATSSMIDNANLIQKVVFPVEVLPTFMSASSLFNMTLALPVVLLGTWLVGHMESYQEQREAAIAAGKVVGPVMQLGFALVAMPVLYVLQMMFMTGLGFFMATLNVLVRDLMQLVGVITMVWMFITPIFYPAALVKKVGFGFLLEINPMYWLIDSYRNVLLYGIWPDPWLLLRFTLASIVVLGVGSRFLAQHRRRFPDLL